MSNLLYGLCLILSACGTSDLAQELPVVNLNNVPTQAVNLSTLLEEVRIIPLETGDNYLISYPQVWFADSFILVGSFQMGAQAQPGRLFRFDLNGKFLNEIGKGGKGPGEHIGVPFGIRYFEDDSLIQVNWGGGGRDPQLFNLSGDFVQAVNVPKLSNSFDFIERLNDSTWFGSGRGIVGPPFSPGDSSLIHFFLSDGTKVSDIPRLKFSTSQRPLAMPPSPAHYMKGNSWKFFVNGLDTLFRIEKMHLVPEVVFQSENFVDYNAITKPEEFDGKELVLSITEGTNYWLLFRQVLQISMGTSWEVPFVLIYKNSLKAINVRLIDDVFQLFPETFFGTNLNWPDGRKPFQGNLMYTVVNADELLELLKNQTGKLDPKMQIELDKLKNLNVDDNPVIFQFKLRSSVDDL
jgi:hypothetical protein